MFERRQSGILLHPTSLPGPQGSGDFGPGARHFIDWLAVAGQALWQVLPLTPSGPGDSPYAGVSAFAGNPLLVALEPLLAQGWLTRDELVDAHGPFDDQRVDFGRVVPFRLDRLGRAAAAFFARANPAQRATYEAWCAAEAEWLEDYALFMAIDTHVQRAHGHRPWSRWEPALARREPAALAAARRALGDSVALWKFVQWCFDTQWAEVRAHARLRQVAVVGDLPIFVAHHSADCWARPDLYHLDEHFEPKVVAGVPPDFFSATGQRWGNPLYDWDAMQRDGFAWWIARLKRQFAWADAVRIDHFRGFAGYWEIPASCPTAIEGRWVPAPGHALFTAIEQALGRLPIIAEDLGLITADVVALRDGFNLPGMRILQFGFSGAADHAFLPHNYSANTVAYTGTHDNDTVLGWWHGATDRERAFARTYLGSSSDGRDLPARMGHVLMQSIARTVLFPLQDVLGLDGMHRMNIPGQLGHWRWRFRWDYVPADTADRLASLGAACGRAPLGRLRLPDWPAGGVKPA